MPTRHCSMTCLLFLLGLVAALPAVDAIQLVSVQPHSANRVKLDWEANFHPGSGFNSQHRIPGGDWQPNSFNRSETYDSIFGLTGDTTYEIRVVAGSVISNVITLTMPSPGTIGLNHNPREATTTTADIGWARRDPSGTSVIIEIRPSGGTFTTYATVDYEDFGITLTGLDPGSVYDVRARVRFADESLSDLSNIVTIRTVPDEESLRPFVHLEFDEISQERISFTWTNYLSNPSFDFEGTHVRVERRVENGPWETDSALNGGSTISHVDRSVDPGTTYSYRVVGTDGDDNITTDYSETITASVPEAGVPSAPSDFTASVTGDAQVTLGWARTGIAVDGYSIERRSGAEDWSELTVLESGGANTHVDGNGLQDGQQYHYRIRGFLDDAGDRTYGPYSQEAEATIPSAAIERGITIDFVGLGDSVTSTISPSEGSASLSLGSSTYSELNGSTSYRIGFSSLFTSN